MKYTVEYIKNKKKGQSTQKAVFLDLEGAILWEKHVTNQGAEDVKITVC
jgi:hypothetical protein